MKLLPDLTIGVLTFLRDDRIFNCIKSMENISIPYELHILDHGRMTPKKTSIYSSLKERGHQVYEWSFHTIRGKCRNHLFNSAKTKYFLMLADDCYLRKDTAETLLNVMKELHDENVRVVAPVLWERVNYRYLTKRLWREGDDVYADLIGYHTKNFDGIDFKVTDSGLRYYPSNYTSSVALFDTEIRDEVNWDPNSAVTHLDLFLQLTQTKWTSVTTPDAVIDHAPGEHPEYGAYKRNHRTKEGKEYIENKWGIKIKSNT